MLLPLVGPEQLVVLEQQEQLLVEGVVHLGLQGLQEHRWTLQLTAAFVHMPF